MGAELRAQGAREAAQKAIQPLSQDGHSAGGSPRSCNGGIRRRARPEALPIVKNSYVGSHQH
jgi:hypothetical protein